MKLQSNYTKLLLKPSDIFLPSSLLIASLMGRQLVALQLFIALYAIKLCSLASSNGLRVAFARQPSMRYVQGSTLVALLLQLPGAAIAAAILGAVPLYKYSSIYPFIVSGLLLNIEQVFYEYLFAVGDGHSAARSRGITALLTLAGLLLCAPPAQGTAAPSAIVTNWLLITSGLSALTSLCLALALGGKLRPKLNAEILRCAPLSMLQTALYPALALAGLYLLFPAFASPIPLFAGLMAYELWRTPFRRSPLESRPMNQILLILCVLAAFGGMLCGFLLTGPAAIPIAASCGAIILAALCAFGMYGSIEIKRDRA